MKSPLETPLRPARDVWQLRLYVAGQTPRTASTLANLKHICTQHIPGNYRLRVIDVRTNPALAKADQIVAIPTLVRTFPEPVRRIVGDLSNRRHALAALDLVETKHP